MNNYYDYFLTNVTQDHDELMTAISKYPDVADNIISTLLAENNLPALIWRPWDLNTVLQSAPKHADAVVENMIKNSNNFMHFFNSSYTFDSVLNFGLCNIKLETAKAFINKGFENPIIFKCYLASDILYFIFCGKTVFYIPQRKYQYLQSPISNLF